MFWHLPFGVGVNQGWMAYVHSTIPIRVSQGLHHNKNVSWWVDKRTELKLWCPSQTGVGSSPVCDTSCPCFVLWMGPNALKRTDCLHSNTNVSGLSGSREHRTQALVFLIKWVWVRLQFVTLMSLHKALEYSWFILEVEGIATTWPSQPTLDAGSVGPYHW